MSWKSRDHKVKHWAGSDFQKVSLAVERAYTPEAKRHFPGTMQLVEDLGLISMREVAFNKQSPQSGLIRHSDKFNYMLTGHLGVSVPNAEEGGGGGLDTPSEKTPTTPEAAAVDSVIPSDPALESPPAVPG